MKDVNPTEVLGLFSLSNRLFTAAKAGIFVFSQIEYALKHILICDEST